MNNRKSTKKALLSSVLCLLLCCSMLIGTTFAWFTDEVVSGKNHIVAGNLDVELEYYKDGAWKSVQDATDLFTGELWEPGHTEVVYLKLSNLGTLALKYQLGINVVSESTGINANNEPFKLSDYIYMGVVEGKEPSFTNREDAVAAVNGAGIISTGYAASGSMTSGAVTYLALVVYMPESVGNEANYKTGTTAPQIDLGINLVATQLTAEEDSFGDDYDAGAWVETMTVSTEAELITALNAAIGKNVMVVLANDIQLTGTWTPVGDKDAGEYFMGTLDGNGYTISGLNVVANDYDALISAAKDATIKNLTVEGTVNGVNAAGIVARVEGNTVIENCVNNVTVTGTTKAGGIACNVTGADAEIINCVNKADISGGKDGIGGIVGYVNNNAYLEIINCANEGNVTSDVNKYAGAAVGYGAQSKGIVAGFANSGVITGTLASNDRFLKDGDTVLVGYVGTPGNWIVATAVNSAAELATVLANAADAGSGDNTIFLTGDIDLTGTTWTPIKVDGYNGAGVITIEGNGATIKGLDAPLFAGGFAGKSGIVIKNLTIADSNIVSTSGLGGGAFVDTADSMQVVTLENCHLVNSTVTGERTGGLIGWCSGYAKLDDGPVKAYVTITNCSVVDSTVIGAGSAGAIAGHPGASDYTYTTIENCVVKNVDVVSNDNGSWRTGAIVGTANNGHVVINNVTVENVTLTQNGVAAEAIVLYGRFVPGTTGTLVIDGANVLPAATTEALKDAITAGQEDIYLPAGNYTMPEPDLRGKTLTIKGTKDTVIDVSNVDARNQFVTGATVVFEGVTLNFGTVNYMGFANTASLTYKDCTINGLQFLYGANVTFENCVLNSNGAEHCVWTYGAQNVSFTGCDFIYGDRGINCYSDNDVTGGKQTVNFTNCTFTTENTASDGAVEINSCFFSVGIEVNMTDCTAPAYGQMAYVSKWDSTNGAKTTINIQ